MSQNPLEVMLALACIFKAQSGRQLTSSSGGGMVMGKQSQRGSFSMSHAKMVGSCTTVLVLECHAGTAWQQQAYRAEPHLYEGKQHDNADEHSPIAMHT